MFSLFYFIPICIAVTSGMNVQSDFFVPKTDLGLEQSSIIIIIIIIIILFFSLLLFVFLMRLGWFNKFAPALGFSAWRMFSFLLFQEELMNPYSFASGFEF